MRQFLQQEMGKLAEEGLAKCKGKIGKGLQLQKLSSPSLGETVGGNLRDHQRKKRPNEKRRSRSAEVGKKRGP